jgi:hypothetical protein
VQRELLRGRRTKTMTTREPSTTQAKKRCTPNPAAALALYRRQVSKMKDRSGHEGWERRTGYLRWLHGAPGPGGTAYPLTRVKGRQPEVRVSARSLA